MLLWCCPAAVSGRPWLFIGLRTPLSVCWLAKSRLLGNHHRLGNLIFGHPATDFRGCLLPAEVEGPTQSENEDVPGNMSLAYQSTLEEQHGS